MLCGCCAVSVILCVAMSPSGGGGGGSPGLSASQLGGGDGRHGVWMLFGYYAGGIFVFLSDGVWL